MPLDTAPTEHVYQISDERQVKLLQNQFEWFYELLAERKFSPDAGVATVYGMRRYLSGMPMHNFNAVMGAPSSGTDFDACIDEQLSYFGKSKTPFIWYVNEEEGEEFKEKLRQRGFVDAGIFRGVMGELNQPVALSAIPDDCMIERVQDEAAMEEFNDLVCSVFKIEGSSKEAYKTISWEMARGEKPELFHWMVRQQGKVVSAVSTLVKDGVISFWNGASLPELRKQGLSTALRRFAVQDGMRRGAKLGSSYLMSEGLAFGICSKLGYTTKWRFRAFLSPTGDTASKK
jgi:hypothetical protein